MAGWLGIKITSLSRATCLPAYCTNIDTTLGLNLRKCTNRIAKGFPYVTIIKVVVCTVYISLTS